MDDPKQVSLHSPAMHRRHFLSLLSSSALIAGVPAPLLARAAGAASSHEKIRTALSPFPLQQVRLLDGPFLQAARTNQKYLLSLQPDRLLHTFRLTAGLPTTAEPLGGWEKPDCELRGHFAGGHYLSACALAYASTGDQEIKARGDLMVAELAKCQKKLGNGYLSAFPESFFDRLRDGGRVWAPFYTIHKILAGHIDMYQLTGNAQALETAKGMADWICNWVAPLGDEHLVRVLETEWGGTNEALYNLYAITGNRWYLRTGDRFRVPSFFDPLAGHRDELKGLHVNTHIPQVIGAARRFEVSGEPYYHEIADYFWHEVTGERTYCTGGTSNFEFWRSDPGDLKGQLSGNTAECCCGYNMLKLTRHLYQWTGDPRFFDYYERTLFNSRLGTQHPDNGGKMYYLPLEAGYWKLYNSPTDSFWCCTGTGAEEFAKFGDSIYFHNDHDLFVNLFIASQVEWPEKGLSVRQQTSFPEQDSTTLEFTVKTPVSAGLHLRIPAWAGEDAAVFVNGEKVPVMSSPGSYLRLDRTWKTGDRVELRLPMRLRVEPLPGDQSYRAVLYGPIVLAGRMGSEGLTHDLEYNGYGPSPKGKPQGKAEVYLEGTLPVESAQWIESVPGQTLTFQTVGQLKAATLIPLYKILGERYAVYWKVNPQV